ncbi:nucleotide exchange factor GrpE [Polycladomyces subterraneus]|uniref:Protein GrpE n=1 Tax=Polycladomyces subterraneus TaxID=1016997 RepID=A0ABT8IPS8_9BACL|nr:nucleotide exchange factor GrpE [Polycladomyces subterraneus]MDN4594783.1 nucleotide exchange factor GrpE [Polycladomyces subterraneus]
MQKEQPAQRRKVWPEGSSAAGEEQAAKDERSGVTEEPVHQEADEPVQQKTEQDLHDNVSPEQYQRTLEELEAWKQKAEEHYEMFLRARADLDNYRKRVRKEKEESAKYAMAPLAEAILPVVDNLERALAAGGNAADAKALHEGVEMVYRQLLQVLRQVGVEPIESVGQPFDPHLHNAVMQEETSDTEPGIVIAELQKGYRFKDRVLRPAMVKVSV